MNKTNTSSPPLSATSINTQPSKQDLDGQVRDIAIKWLWEHPNNSLHDFVELALRQTNKQFQSRN